MPAFIDLHVHSNASDGRQSVRTIASLAAGLPDLAALAVTDHDSANGVPLLRRYRDEIAGGPPPKVLDGIEVSVSWKGGVLHLLGYFPCGGLTKAEGLRELCRRNVEDNRISSVLHFGPRAAIARLEKRHRDLLGTRPGFEVAAILDDVSARHRRRVHAVARDLGGDPLWPFPPAGRTWREALAQRAVAPLHVLEHFVARDRRKEPDYVAYWEELLRKRAGRPIRPDEAERIRQAAREDLGFILNAEESSIDLATGIAAMREANGIPVLAHPVPSLRLGPGSSFEEGLRAVTAAGVAGFEAYYSLHTNEETARIAAFCRHNGLLVTGGSDYHGKRGTAIADLGAGRRVPLLDIVDELGH